VGWCFGAIGVPEIQANRRRAGDYSNEGQQPSSSRRPVRTWQVMSSRRWPTSFQTAYIGRLEHNPAAKAERVACPQLVGERAPLTAVEAAGNRTGIRCKQKADGRQARRVFPSQFHDIIDDGFFVAGDIERKTLVYLVINTKNVERARSHDDSRCSLDCSYESEPTLDHCR
jgi:hypothetical protein